MKLAIVTTVIKKMLGHRASNLLSLKVTGMFPDCCRPPLQITGFDIGRDMAQLDVLRAAGLETLAQAALQGPAKGRVANAGIPTCGSLQRTGEPSDASTRKAAPILCQNRLLQLS